MDKMRDDIKYYKQYSKKFFEYQKLTQYIIKEYDDFIDYGISKIMDKNKIEYVDTQGDKIEIDIKLKSIDKPIQRTEKNEIKRLYPYEARLYKQNYSSNTYVDIKIKKNNKIIGTSNDKKFFTIPTMLGSKICYLNDLNRLPKNKQDKRGTLKNPKIFADIYECYLDPLGYFIMNGTEKALITQEKLSTNIPFIIKENLNNKKTTMNEIRSEDDNNNISLLRLFTKTYNKKNTKYIVVSLPFIKNKNKDMNIFTFLKLLFFVYKDIFVEDANKYSDEQLNHIIHTYTFDYMFTFVYMFTDNEDIIKMFLNSVSENDTIYSYDKFIMYISENLALSSIDYVIDQQENDIKNVNLKKQVNYNIDMDMIRDEYIYKKFLPHINYINKNKIDIDIVNNIQYDDDEPQEENMNIDININRDTDRKINVDENINENIDKYENIDQDEHYENEDTEKNIYENINQHENNKIKNILRIKIFTLIKMAVNLIETELGLREYSNRNDYNYKKLESPAILIESLFTKLYKIFKMNVEKTLKNIQNINTTAIITKINSEKDKITNNMRDSFVTQDWGIKNGKTTTGVSQALSVLSMIAKYSYLRRVNTPGNKSGKQMKTRMINPTQYGVICSGYTPEGEACGLIKNLAVSAYITPYRSPSKIYSLLSNGKYIYKYKDENKNIDTLLNINGIYIGYCQGELIKNILINMRRKNEIDKFTSITLKIENTKYENNKILEIFTTKGRQVRPLYIVENNQLLIEKLGLLYQNLQFSELIKQGVVEYLDVNEIEYSMIAIDPTIIKNNNNIQYTHCEIDSSWQFGVAANAMNLLQHNPSPRVSYTTNMLNQNVSIPMTNYKYRPDTGLKILHYPQKSLLQTDISKVIGLDQLPGSQIVITAILPFEYNLDDSIIINQASLQRGLFNSDVYDIYTVETDDRMDSISTQSDKYPNIKNGVIQEFEMSYLDYTKYYDDKLSDDVIKQLKSKNIYITDYYYDTIDKKHVYKFKKPLTSDNYIYTTRTIDKDNDQENNDMFNFINTIGGRVKQRKIIDNKIIYTIAIPHKPRRSTYVKYGDVLAVKTTTTSEGKSIETNIYMSGKRGVVDKVFRKKKSRNTEIVKIRIRTSHYGDIGDKFCAPYAQKGVIGLIVPEVDMPHTSEGIRPDIIINPHAIPSRMTIGVLLEILIGKSMICSKKSLDYTYIDDNIFNNPIININKSNITFNDLSDLQQRAFIYLYNDNSNIIDSYVRQPNNVIPNNIINIKYANKKFNLLPLNQLKAYNILHNIENYPKSNACDATPFRRVNMDDITKKLKQLGYQPFGTETLMSGITGRILQGRIFMGVCNYLALKHMVEEKIHARDTGRRQAINRQATKGKKKNGGIRFGQMESDVIQAHGSTNILQERLFKTTDYYTSYICQKQQDICYLDGESQQFVCNSDNIDVDPVRVTIPYSFQILNNYWKAMGIKAQLFTDKPTDVADVARQSLYDAKK